MLNKPPLNFSENEVHTGNHVISKFFTISEDVGEVSAVAVQYDKTTSIVVGWAYPNDWALAGLSLFSGETQQLYVFSHYILTSQGLYIIW